MNAESNDNGINAPTISAAFRSSRNTKRTRVTRAADDVIAAFLARHAGDFAAVPLKEIVGKPRALSVGDGDVLRVLPHRHDTDGFYAAVLRRTAS